MKRVLCAYLPVWPLQRWENANAALRGKATALVDFGAPRGAQLVLCSPRAARAGLRPGMPLAEALAIEHALHTREDDPAEDRRALEDLARWAGCFSPLVALEEGPRPETLLLDITGCAACFSGEDLLLDRASAAFRARGWQARLAIADTIGAAWGLAHYGSTPCRVPPGETERVLSTLPIAALRLPLDALHLLTQLGIERVAQLMALPREALPTRFGPLVLTRLDQALGTLAEVIEPHRPLEEIQVRFEFEFTTSRLDVLNQVLEGLTEQLHALLRSRLQGARWIECSLHHEGTAPTRFEIGLSRPSRAPGHLGLLLRQRLEQVRLAGAVTLLSLRVTMAEPLPYTQGEFLEGSSRLDEAGLVAFIDRLGNRLGRDAVTRPRLVADSQPEYACRFEPMLGGQKPPLSSRGRKRKGAAHAVSGCSGAEPLTNVRGSSHTVQPLTDVRGSAITLRAQTFTTYERFPLTRPLQLRSRPEPIEVMSVVPDGPPVRMTWAGISYRIGRSWGPERIETGWWRNEDVQRDYYVAETEQGNRFWIFRCRDDGRWFLHGFFD